MARHREFDEEKALKGAMNVFWQRGYAGAGMQELCTAMGLNPGSLYAAFGSKRELFFLVMRRYLETVTQEGIARIQAADSGSAGIRAYFAYLVDGIVDGRRQWGCLGTNAFLELGDRDEEVNAIMTAHYKRLETAFLTAIQRDAPDADAHRASERATYLVCVAQGLNVLARTRPTRAMLSSIAEQATGDLADRAA
ncbi:TetR/AcrR family transcriptional regulator [Paracoccus zhejiangensis]|uniref:TetR/AcrR family transcriptional regulator n=1 Tax=Paracoccus zhejiangensis TaxID=1077935 RepID=A0A2H5F354_9RHOB|nr:TetR/AcrR family transcriptional regulator [Paracoccus zhejiangensis]AUH65974.1 TetR/AcrR family transcriptional regulator [Paracoccus zhejiangensis]